MFKKELKKRLRSARRIGIQPKGLDFGSRCSKITHKAAQRVSDAVRRAAAGS